MRAKNTFTIHTELIDGTLLGARNIYMGANSTCHLYVIPRDEINIANSIIDIAGQPALKPEAYIGQTTDFANRKNDHVQKKDFWKTALVFVSDNHKIYGDDVKYLEYIGIEAAQSVDSFSLLNGANPRKPNIAPFRVNDMEVFFRDIQLLTRFYGCGIFDVPVAKPQPEHLFYVHATDRPAEGIGYYDENAKQFVLVKGSIIASEIVTSFKSIAAREKFIKDHCKTDKGQIVLQHDVPMDSPSGASGIILGRPSNGWDDWKDADGKKLGKVVKR
ncbi:MAG: GIY-YIG nuclease family protein [Paludibacteraceae bacterium]|nr:GIY-YIG nuclease family protein [Paludibacteraceae bacterium]